MSEELPVTLVTVDATVDADDATYMAGLLDLWQNEAKQSYPKLLTILGEPMSRKAWWHHRITGNRTTFGPDERNLLRAAKLRSSGPVRPSVTAVTERMVHPDAAVHWIGPLVEGDEQSRTVLIVASNLPSVEISVNGTISARTSAHPQETPVTPVISSHSAKRAPVYRPVLSLQMKERIEASGMSVEELIEMALRGVTG